ncbi:hypothetical protein D3C71_1470640 [compost metagenome]
MEKASRLIKRMAEAEVQAPAAQGNITNDVYEFIIDKAKYDLDSDFDQNDQTGYVNVVATFSTSSLFDKFKQLTSADLNAISAGLKSDQYVLESIKDAAVDARNHNIEAEWITTPSDYSVTVNDKTIMIEANYTIDQSQNVQNTNENNPEDYHNQKDFV